MKILTALPLIVSCLLPCCSAAQGAVVGEKYQAPASRRVPQFELVDGTLLDGVQELAKLQLVHLGIEEILQNKFSDPPIATPRFSVRLSNSTVGDILDALCQYDGRYAWSADGASLNVYPRARMEDPSYMLNRHLIRITVEAIPDPDKALLFLDRQLPSPREHFGYIAVGGDDRYPSPWTASFENMTVRQFINRVAEHMGAQSTWILQGSNDEKLFSFHTGAFGLIR